MQPLAIAKKLFQRLNSENIYYCHWKSNLALPASLAGKTDLDLLIAEAEKGKFRSILSSLDILEVISPYEKRFPGIEDHIGFDTETGALIHLHVHYQLILGEKFIKNHRLPLESLFLENTRLLFDVKVPLPELELIILFVRAHLKLSIPKKAISSATPLSNFLPSDILEELSWLLNEVATSKRFPEFLEQTPLVSIPVNIPEYSEQLLANEISSAQANGIRDMLLELLRPYRRSNNNIEAFFRVSLGNFFRKPYSKKIFLPRLKRFPNALPVFAFLGADGAGKSTLVRDLHLWLSWKIINAPKYLGLPRRSRRYRILRYVADHWRKRPFTRLLGNFAWNFHWLVAAWIRLGTAKKGQRLARKGCVVLCDRYPLSEFWTMPEPMDGPRITGRGPITRVLRFCERCLYRSLPRPQRAFVLQANIENLRKRKNDLPLEQHQVKVAALANLPKELPFVTVSVEAAYADVLLKLKNLLWQEITKAQNKAGKIQAKP